MQQDKKKDETSWAFLELMAASNIEEQCDKIANWIKQHYHVSGIGFFLDDTIENRTYRYDEEIPQAIFNDLASRVPKLDSTEKTEDHVLFFGQEQGHLSVFNPQEQPRPLEPMGLTIPLTIHGRNVGALSLVAETATLQSLAEGTSELRSYIPPISCLLENSILHDKKDKKIQLLNLYQTVSSSLAYIIDLFELLTTIISIVTTELSCEEGSVLLYDEETNEFEFFTAVGETGMELVKVRFPADKGIAGRALREQTTLVVNDAQNCPDFYCSIDKQHGFTTRSIVAAPLISGDEKVGVINAINKTENKDFDQDDDQILSAIADEVALAVKNAKLFDYVVHSYCKIKQGQNSCRGCKRPLKSWTPCVKYLNL